MDMEGIRAHRSRQEHGRAGAGAGQPPHARLGSGGGDLSLQLDRDRSRHPRSHAVGASVVWDYPGGAQSSGQGSFRIGDDGSRVIGWGMGSKRGLAFTEVDEQGRDLVDLSFTDGDSSYRVIKVLPTSFDLDVLRKT